jgi:uncharacterized OB-fold protein
MSESYLHPGLPKPVPAPDGLDAAYWQGLQENRLMIQRCSSCHKWQWGPEWVCFRCHGFDLGFEEVQPRGFIYSHERVWHPVHPALKEQGPYVVILVEIPEADGIRVVGNLLGDPQQELIIGSEVTGVFEHHGDETPSFTLLQWQLT